MRFALLITVATTVSCAPDEQAGAVNDNRSILDPPSSGRVLDAANVISEAQELAINKRAQHLFETTGDALYVIALPSLDGRAIEETALAYGRGWGVGDAERDNGILLLSGIEEQQVRIEVGYGLEALMTDLAAAKIISDDIIPVMRAGDLGRGHVVGVEAIADFLESDSARPRYQSELRRAAS